MKRLLCAFLILLALGASTAGGAGAAGAQLREAFGIVAFRAEYDDPDADMLRRWETPPVIFLDGGFTRKDKAGLEEFVAQLNVNVSSLPEVSITKTKRNANIRITFAPLSRMDDIQPGYVPGNWGFFYFTYDENGFIREAVITVASDVTNQAERDHLIREEIVGALGLCNDQDMYPDSILYSGWTTTRDLNDMDWALMNLLYDRRLTPGMTWSQAKSALGWE